MKFEKIEKEALKPDGLQLSGGPELGGISRCLPIEPWFMLVTGPCPLDVGAPEMDIPEDEGAILDEGIDLGVFDVGRGSPRC